MKKKKDTLLINSLLIQSIINGFAGNVLTVFVSEIALGFGLSVTELGAMLSLNFVSMIVVPIIVGRIADKKGKKMVIIAGICFQYAGYLLMGFSPNVTVYIIGFILRAIGQSAGMVVNSSSIVDTYPDRATKYYSYMQSVGNGAGIVAPVVLAFLARNLNLSWRTLVLIFSTLSMIPLISISMAEVKRPPQSAKPATGKTNVFKDYASAMSVPLLFCILTLTFFCAMDNPYMGFMDIFFATGLSSGLGALAITIHSVGYVVSRFLTGYVTPKYERPVLISCAVINIASLIGVSIIKNDILAVVLIAIISLSAGPIYPIMIMRAMRESPENSATAVSLMTVGNGVGGTLGNILTGVIADNIGIKFAFGFLALFTILCLTMFLFQDGNKNSKAHYREIAE